MELIAEITKYLNHFTNVDLVAFNTLNYYDNNNQEHLDYINKLTTLINNNLMSYNNTPTTELYNILENDYYTLKDVVKEYEEKIYPLFSFSALSIYIMLNKDEITLVSNYMLNINQNAYSYLINLINDNLNPEDKIKFNDGLITADKIKNYINIIKNKIGGAIYYQVLAAYLNYEFRCCSDV